MIMEYHTYLIVLKKLALVVLHLITLNLYYIFVFVVGVALKTSSSDWSKAHYKDSRKENTPLEYL